MARTGIAIALLMWLAAPQAIAVGSLESGARLELRKLAQPVTPVGEGFYSTAIEIVARNTGTTKLYELQVLDAIAEQIAPAKVVRVLDLRLSGDLTALNPLFDGVGQSALLGGQEWLKPGQQAVIGFSLIFDPQGAPGPFQNRARGLATDPGGDRVVDECSKVDAAGAACEPTRIEVPEPPAQPLIGLAKSAAESVLLPSGEFLTTLSFVVANLGDVEVADLILIDDLRETFAEAADFRVVTDSLTGSGLALDPAYNGRDRRNLLMPGGRLAAGASATLSVAVVFDPGQADPPFYNRALLSGVDPVTGSEVAEWSNAGWDPESEGLMPTPVHFDPGLLGPAVLGVSKTVESLEVLENGYQIAFRIRLRNLGAVPIDKVQVLDDLKLAFPAPAQPSILSGPYISGSLTEVNANFGLNDPYLLSGVERLDPGASADIRFGVLLVLNGATGPFANQAVASGIDPKGEPVSDESDDGPDPDPDGDGDPGGDGEDDPTPIDLPAGIRGSLYRDDNHNRLRDPDDRPADRWIVVVDGRREEPVRVAVDSQGAFEVPRLPPGEYALTFLHPDNGVAWGRTSVLIEPGAVSQVDELVDGQGIVYESGRRVPLPGVVLSIGLGDGGALPQACLLPGQQNQTVDGEGAYRFDVQFGVDGACPDGVTEFLLTVLEVPGGFTTEVSRDLPPESESLSLGECSPEGVLPCIVQTQPGAPAGADATDYYLRLLWGPGDSGTANNHIPIDRPAQAAPGGEILVTYFVDRSRATIGDILGFRVPVLNLSEVPLVGVTIQINPPAGLPAIDDSLVLVRAGSDGELGTSDDVSVPLPVPDPRGFEAFIGALAVGETVEVRYAARVSPGITPGVKVSKADGLVENGVRDSASVSVRIEADPMLQKTTIIGKVFHDLNGDGIQSHSEPGISGARLATLGGLLVETDSEGRYHIADVDTGRQDRGANFMIKLDGQSLPGGLDFRRSERQVVRLTPGLMTRINFPVRSEERPDDPSAEAAEIDLLSRTDRLRGEPRLDVLALPRVLVRNTDGVQMIDFAIYSNYPRFISSYRISLFDLTDPRFVREIPQLGNLALVAAETHADLLTGRVNIRLSEAVQRIGYRLTAYGVCDRISGQPFDRTALRLLEVQPPGDTSSDRRSPLEIFGQSSLEVQNIEVSGDRVLRELGRPEPPLRVDIQRYPIPIGPLPAGTRGSLRATYRVAGPDGESSAERPLLVGNETWAVFDHEGLPAGAGGVVDFDPQRSVSAVAKNLDFVDPDIARGLHETQLNCGCTTMAAHTIIDASKASLSLRLSNRGVRVEMPELELFNDFANCPSPTGRVEIGAVTGQPMLRRTLSTMEAGTTQEVFLGRFDADRYQTDTSWACARVTFSNQTMGDYVPAFTLERARDGALEPRIWASCDGVSAQPDTTRPENMLAAMVVEGWDAPHEASEPPPDQLFAMGLINLTLGANDVSGNLEALSDDDHYDESVFVDGRVAGYLRGKIRGRYLVTAQVDTTEDELKNLGDNLQRKDPQRIFRQLDPDRYYPVYGDDSTTTSDVESQGAMYLRVDWDESTGLWGNYNTGFTDTEFAQYNRSLYGAKLDYKSTATNQYGENRQSLKVFASEAQTQSAQTSFRATGGSLYYLPHRDIVQGSEKLWIEVRARDGEQVLDTEVLLPGRDYEIDDLQGRILLSRPLSPVVRERSNSIVRSAPLDGDRVFLMADYEHVPDGFETDDLTTGIRTRWASDSFGLGLSRVDDQRDGRDYALTGTDAQWQLSERSFLRGEFARSEARQNDVNALSYDGGLTFSEALLPIASDDLEGNAWGIEAHIDLADLPGFRNREADLDGGVRLWHKEREAGFSSGRLGERGELTDSGLAVDIEMSERQTLSASTTRVEREFGLDETVVRAQTDLSDLGCDLKTGCFDFGFEARYENLEQVGSATLPGNPLPVGGDALLVGARIGKSVDEATTLYTSMQTAVQSSEAYRDNDLLSVGVNRTLNERMGVSLEASDGDRGEALIGGVDYVREDGSALNLSGGVGSGAMTQFGTRYALAEGNELYGTYTVNPDRTDGARNLLTLGQRRQMDDSVGVFTETTFGRDDGYADSAHVFGLDYQADQNWLISSRLQASDLKGEGIDIERQVASLGAGYQKDGRRIATRIEARRDKSGGLDTWQYLTSNLFGMKSGSGSRSWVGKLNLAWTDNEAAGIDDGRFIEFDIGYALRPIKHDRINALAKYSFLYDLGSNGQLGPNGRAGEQVEERSHVLSAEVLYDLSDTRFDLDGVEVGTKLAGKFGEQRVFETGEWYDTRLGFAAVRARYRLIGAGDNPADGHWEALTEYRFLKDFEDNSLRHGALVGLYYVKPMSIREDTVQMRVGVGYNFTDFDSDLRRDGYRSGGWFIDVSAAY